MSELVSLCCNTLKLEGESMIVCELDKNVPVLELVVIAAHIFLEGSGHGIRRPALV